MLKNLFKSCLLFLSLHLGLVSIVKAQLLTTLPRGGNKRATVSEQVGISDIIIRYSRPGVKKRDGYIWGELIPVGFTDLGYGAKKPAPWRAGANENTTFECSTDIKIEGQDLPAGKYGFFIAYAPNECTIIFSKNSTSWGNFFYDSTEDALRVKVKPVKIDKSVEWLKYEFAEQTSSNAIVQLQWEKLMIPFKIEVDVNKTQIASFRKELRGDKVLPGLWQGWNQAAAYCAANNTNLEEGLMWADSAISFRFGGSTTFSPWQTKAAILDKLGRKAEADAIIKKALPYADELEAYNYGIGLVEAKRSKEAFEVFKMNYTKFPNSFFSLVGMESGYSAIGDYKKALEFAQKALPQARGGNKLELERNIKDLQNGKDMNDYLLIKLPKHKIMNEENKKMMLAQQKAIELFNIVEQRGLIIAGKTEKQLSDEIVQIAKEVFGTENHWGKKIVRTGVNTLQPYSANPKNLVIQEGDILFIDFHPVFEGWEADLGRTYVLGNDPLKLKIKKDVEAAWYEGNDWFTKQTKLTGAQFFEYATNLAKRYGYEFGNAIAGHIIGKYPHEQPDDPNDLCLDVHPDNNTDILQLDKFGNKRHWILELHFVDRNNNTGAFFEQLLIE